MKIITMYLPQFYRTKENDLWWGKGFTDWVTVKNAESMFEGHFQPRKPLEGMYDLSEKSTMLRQAELMKKYGIYGQCFYHYWFKDRKIVLEKPAENLLKWKDIDMPFCFSWANEAWVRSWKMSGLANVWAQKYETDENGDDGVLLAQEYGDKDAWIRHFLYFLPFFLDNRYIRIQDKPVLMIYRPDLIHCLKSMIETWRECAIQHGLNGLYIIGANVIDNYGVLDACYIHATASIMPQDKYSVINDIKTIDYDAVWKHILSEAKFADTNTFVGGLVDFDTTPRKGKNGVVIKGGDADKYELFLRRLLAINEKNGKEITFLNAWNEWGESMYLEPDVDRGYSFLEATNRALKTYNNETEESILNNNDIEVFHTYKRLALQNKRNVILLDRWLSKIEQGNHFCDYFKRKGIHSIAIYGLGMIGIHLQRQLLAEGDNLIYIIDQRKKGIHNSVPVYDLDDLLPQVDLIIVTVLSEYETIKKHIEHVTKSRVISFYELIYDEETNK